ncbi:tRNA lysidine(34) synthetase TilS [Polaribacter porphyrae]|uniref:tRNA(Ile)-lysidine synthase n=2 Tax=Polaribacter porphyrae TaxID=1137780 RepID=A0A2S7WQ31_9FLAO|nr:tRNA lysidine(34) synthetase TilS [Polaribacter porphyrae]PQJ79684.1 tRNA lysidine(34) synthetase TilS [Polaribacter porphyrae]
MLQKFTKHININFPFLKDASLLMTISGGLDSVVLTHLLNTLNFDVSLAHCNFKLREKESDLDEKFAIKLSQKSCNQIFTKKFDTNQFAIKNKLSTQIAARELRYSWFQVLAAKHNFDYILTAHHADDNLETFLINLTRGTGLEGFTGIPTKNENIIRPLLPFSRDEILAYATKNNLTWREDASNASTKYIRNKIRHQVLPILKEINPSLLSSFSKTLNHLQESKKIVEDRINEVSSEILQSENGIIKFDIAKLTSLSNPKAYLYQLLKKYNFTEWNDVVNLLDAESGKYVISSSHQLIKDRDFLLLSKNKDVTLSKVESFFQIDKNTSEITKPIHLVFKEVDEKSTQKKQAILVDKDLLKYPLILRKWKNGDYLYPTGMQGKKKLSKFFKDEKFSLLEKQNAWLLCNAENEIIWVINHRQDRRSSVNINTKNILQITL